MVREGGKNPFHHSLPESLSLPRSGARGGTNGLIYFILPDVYFKLILLGQMSGQNSCWSRFCSLT